jgi:hypothetical protein
MTHNATEAPPPRPPLPPRPHVRILRRDCLAGRIAPALKPTWALAVGIVAAVLAVLCLVAFVLHTQIDPHFGVGIHHREGGAVAGLPVSKQELLRKLQPIQWAGRARRSLADPLCASKQPLAYAFYAIDDASSIVAAVNIWRLYAFGKRKDADVVVVVIKDAPARVTRRLVRAGATCIVKRAIAESTRKDTTWRLSNLKLPTLGLDQWERVVYFDADGLIISNPDHLFQVPLNDSYPIAMPRAY